MMTIKLFGKTNNVLIFFGFVLFFGSCVTTKKTAYLQDGLSDFEFYEDSISHIYRVQPTDNLYIRVITPDPKWAEMFNTLPVSAPTMSVGEPSLDLISYSVGEDGKVIIPYLGPIKVGGYTLQEVQYVIDSALADYITDAQITVKLVNNYVNILGEVNRPGRYPIYKEKMNVFQALAMAGDLSDYSERGEVQVIRETQEGKIIEVLDLNDVNILHSRYYYILPNDIIYAKAMKGKFFALNSFPYAVIISSITTFFLFLNYFQSNP